MKNRTNWDYKVAQSLWAGLDSATTVLMAGIHYRLMKNIPVFYHRCWLKPYALQHIQYKTCEDCGQEFPPIKKLRIMVRMKEFGDSRSSA